MKIFVYGSLREGEYNHDRFPLGDKIADGVIHGACMYDLGYYPCIVQSDDLSNRVWGEVYEPSLESSKAIENMEYGAGYTRESVAVLTTDGNQIRAFAYFFPKNRKFPVNGHIPHGDWVRHSTGR